MNIERIQINKTDYAYIDKNAKIKENDLVYCPVLNTIFEVNFNTFLMLKNLAFDDKGKSVYKKEWLTKVIKTNIQRK